MRQVIQFQDRSGRAGKDVCQSVLPQAADRWKLKRSGGEGGGGGRRRSAAAWMGAKASSPCCFKSGGWGGVGGWQQHPSQPEEALPQALRGRAESRLRKS